MGVTKDGEAKIKRWKFATEHIADLKRRLNMAECELHNSKEELAKWLLPDDAKASETFCVWYGDSLLAAIHCLRRNMRTEVTLLSYGHGAKVGTSWASNETSTIGGDVAMRVTAESNNAIVVELQNVRPHPNADRLKLATVVGDQVVVGLDAKDGDVVIYFDSNLCLSHEYLHQNSLYSNSELNSDTTVSGYFGKNGRVRAQKFRGSMSNGFVAEISSLGMAGADVELVVGDEFTNIGGVQVCQKYVVPTKGSNARAGIKKTRQPASRMFWKHWDTKHLMRKHYCIPSGVVYLEEKIHGTSGRTGKVLCSTGRPWWKFWAPKEEWRVVSGTRRVDSVRVHLREIREEIEQKVAPYLRKGEQLYYEIFGNTKTNCRPCGTNSFKGGVNIQQGFPYGCRQGEYRVILYRVTVTTPDGLCVGLSREAVYRRAAELGLEVPPLLGRGIYDATTGKAMVSALSGWTYDREAMTLDELKAETCGKSTLDAGTLLEGVVVWFEDAEGKWDCLKLKSDEFLLLEDKQREKGVGDVEDTE